MSSLRLWPMKTVLEGGPWPGHRGKGTACGALSGRGWDFSPSRRVCKGLCDCRGSFLGICYPSRVMWAFSSDLFTAESF